MPSVVMIFAMLFLGFYVMPCLVALSLIPHQLRSWDMSYAKRTEASLATRWSATFVASSGSTAYPYATCRPTNSDKLSYVLYAVTPILNLAVLLLVAVVFLCIVVRKVFVRVSFSNEGNFQRWLNAY